MKQLVNPIIATVEAIGACRTLWPSLHVKPCNTQPDTPVFDKSSRSKWSCAALPIAIVMAAVASAQAVVTNLERVHYQEQIGQVQGAQYAQGTAPAASLFAGARAFDETRISPLRPNGLLCDDRRCPGCHERATTRNELKASATSVVYAAVPTIGTRQFGQSKLKQESGNFLFLKTGPCFPGVCAYKVKPVNNWRCNQKEID
jgi:hypothetical protein